MHPSPQHRVSMCNCRLLLSLRKKRPSSTPLFAFTPTGQTSLEIVEAQMPSPKLCCVLKSIQQKLSHETVLYPDTWHYQFPHCTALPRNLFAFSLNMSLSGQAVEDPVLQYSWLSYLPFPTAIILDTSPSGLLYLHFPPPTSGLFFFFFFPQE